MRIPCKDKVVDGTCGGGSGAGTEAEARGNIDREWVGEICIWGGVKNRGFAIVPVVGSARFFLQDEGNRADSGTTELLDAEYLVDPAISGVGVGHGIPDCAGDGVVVQDQFKLDALPSLLKND